MSPTRGSRNGHGKLTGWWADFSPGSFARGLLAFLLTNDVVGVLRQQTASTLWWTYFFGVLWGFGGLTFGLTMRYLGMSLGMGVALGYCAALGTLVPPIFKGFIPEIPVPRDHRANRFNHVRARSRWPASRVCMVGIGIAALAGWTKEKEMPDEQKKKVIKEFSFQKGILVATFSGVMSACFSFALTAGSAISDDSLKAGTPVLWTGLPRLIVVLLGGFTTNFIWCVLLNIKNKSGYQYTASLIRPEHAGLTASGAEHDGESGPAGTVTAADLRVPVLANYLFCALAGTTWYFQFFFYTMGETQMGKYKFASWTLHMASIIIFSTMWGWILHEWKGSSKKAHLLIGGGIGTLILSTIIIAYGARLKSLQ